MPDTPLEEAREARGRLVRETWVVWALEQPYCKPSWLLPWELLDDGQREVDMRIGDAVAAQAKAEAVEPFMRAYNLGSTILMMEAYRAAEARHTLSTSTDG